MSKEVLFEVWNQPASELLAGTEIFLGLGIVSVDELGLNESQRLIVPLQARTTKFRWTYSSVPNRRARPNKRAGGKILQKH